MENRHRKYRREHVVIQEGGDGRRGLNLWF